MAKLIILMLFFTVAGIDNLSAQQINQEDAIATVKIDARKFKLEKDLLIEWRKRKLSTSDYFKPNVNTTANQTLLNDSNYVHKFRAITHEKTSLRLSTGRWALIIGAGFLGAIAVVAAAFTLIRWH